MIQRRRGWWKFSRFGLGSRNGKGGSRRPLPFLDLYSYFIKLTLFTTPTFADLYFGWNQDFGWFSGWLGA
jgi:hypothetical protein